MSEPDWMTDWTVQVRLWVERSGEAVLGEGRAELLAGIDREHSITKAAKAAGVSYRRAWTMVQQMNAAAGEPLVETAAGGPKGGGARLTPRGRLALSVYERVRQSLIESAAGALQRCVQPGQRATSAVHLAAAISLQEAIGQILAEFALRRPTIHVRTVFGASNEVAEHLRAGAPGDVFVSAEPAELDRLEAERLLVAGSRRVIAKNGLALVGIPGLKQVRNVGDLTAPHVKHIAIAEPACPLGRYAKLYLESAGAYEQLSPKLLHVDNSRAVLAAVESGAAQVGIAFSSDASRPGTYETLVRVPASRAAATYEAALVGRGEPHADAKPLLEFLTSPAAQRCLRRCGLRPAKT